MTTHTKQMPHTAGRDREHDLFAYCEDLGRRAPLFGLFPLRILRAIRRRKQG